MSDLADEPTPPSDVAPIPVQPLRFCGTCGAEWQPDWSQCLGCAARAAARQRALEGGVEIAREKRAIVNAIALYGSLLAVSIISMFVATAQGHKLRLYGLAVEEIVFSSVIFVWSIASIRQLWPALKRPGAFKWIAAAPGLGLTTFIVAAMAVTGISRLSGTRTLQYLDIFTKAGYGLGLGTLFIAVQPAIFEELAFRGIIYESLRRVTGSTEAIFASAAMFAILHLSIPSFTHLFLMGIVLAWLREKSGSLYAGMIVHFTHNFLCLVQEHYSGLFSW